MNIHFECVIISVGGTTGEWDYTHLSVCMNLSCRKPVTQGL